MPFEIKNFELNDFQKGIMKRLQSGEVLLAPDTGGFHFVGHFLEHINVMKILKLFKAGYIERRKKSNVVYLTEIGKLYNDFR